MIPGMLPLMFLAFVMIYLFEFLQKNLGVNYPSEMLF